MGYRIPDRPIDPPERRLTADDIEGLIEQTEAVATTVYGAEMLVVFRGPVWRALCDARIALDEAVEALQIARQSLEGE